MDRPSSAMVYAAGFGTRMGRLVARKPKPLLEVAGKPLLEHALEVVEAANFETVVVNAHYKADSIVRFLEDRPNVQVLIEAPEILETGGGLANALPILGPNPVFTLNSDAVWRGPSPFECLNRDWKPEKMDALLLVVSLADSHGHQGSGDFSMSSDGQLRRSVAARGLVYTGAQIINTDLLAEFGSGAYSIVKVWESVAAKQRLFGAVYDGLWADAGTPHGLERANSMLAAC
ncbi:MAG: nucleotidyltransferase family protein [Albidovulum sp.]|nr:nucleotidyltransferase family protein [Albidovulum sp.]MDE0306391.1 nucleotidyltransferase family protein [Albidovulum sp.]MDE0532203.1 nucleotidyltransferase family protein [Albidovulum sp.]